ncbi:MULTISPECIES: thymidine phosphorylase [Nitrospirillum]|uniref:Thymidine phosphorylase n=1 Tax=Nitrospirillum amazonense TaxID=28077 RepID=A0A560FQX9_9PROT|nr:thymidine phosphorylase [Nitrospirillum amazonense]MEC4595163.1 thymidine phosphorylase [Nitrospirillum amazonense]TWB24014.1 thymidine phosphorylase [Nitrospirillum amazonense]
MLPQEIIRQKRDGGRLAAADITDFVRGLTDGRVTEGQAAAFAMAVYFQGLEMEERVALTRAMTQSGTVMEWRSQNLPGPILDKHSTGGVGDKVSLLLAPLVAACGGFVPMLSGRGLGHTGGTFDKMESIPGYVVQPDLERLRQVVREVGCAVIGATSDLAPADRRLYSIRDVTATVESIDLITASILSKKLAAGLDGLVMDVKFGSGAFMAKYDDAQALARSIASVARGAGLPTVSLLTDMNEVLGTTAGNAVEVAECVAILKGEAPEARLWEVTRELTAELVLLGGLAADLDEARAKVDRALADGSAADRFSRMVTALGGPADFLERSDTYLAAAPVVRDIHAAEAGTVIAVDTRAVGIAVVALGGGRTRPQDGVDHRVGFTGIVGLGDQVDPTGRPLARVHAATEADADAAVAALRQAFTLGAGPATRGPTVTERIVG